MQCVVLLHMSRKFVLFLLVAIIFLHYSHAQVNRSIIEYDEPPKWLTPIQVAEDTQKNIDDSSSSKRSALTQSYANYPVTIYKRILNESYDDNYYINDYIYIYVEIKCYRAVDNLYIWEQCDPGLEIDQCTKPIRTSDINETFDIYKHFEHFKNNNTYNIYNDTNKIHYIFKDLAPTESIIYVYRCSPSKNGVLSSYTITRVYDNPNYNDRYEPLDVNVISSKPQFQIELDNIPTKIDADTPLDIRYFVTYIGGANDDGFCNVSIEFKENQLDYLFLDDKKLINTTKFELNKPLVVERKIKYIRHDMCSIPVIWINSDPWRSGEKILVEGTGDKLWNLIYAIIISLIAGSAPTLLMLYIQARENRTSKRKISKEGLYDKIKLWHWNK